MARPRLELRQEPPSDEERRAGDFFDCPGCEETWALRYKHPREILCLACGRALVRDRKRAQRARLRGADAPTPPTPQRAEVIEVLGKKMRAADVLEAADPAVLKEIDRVVEEATRKRRGGKKPGTGLVRR